MGRLAGIRMPFRGSAGGGGGSSIARWKDPVQGLSYRGNFTVAGIDGIGSPTFGDVVVATDAGTPAAGASDALVPGDVTEFNGTE